MGCSFCGGSAHAGVRLVQGATGARGTSNKADACWKNPASGSYRPEYAQAMAEKDRKIAGGTR